MAKQNKVLVTFSNKYTREFEFVQKQQNMSKYIAELVKRELDSNGEVIVSDYGKMKDAMREVLDEYEFGITANKKENEKEIPDYSDLIDDLFNV